MIQPSVATCTSGRILAFLSCVFLGTACVGEAPARPDLVLITVDRFATDQLPCFEGESDPGDAVCALAEGGTLFAWTAASGAGEAAAAASVLTGLPHTAHGVTDDGQSFLRDPNVTIAEELSQVGYATAAFVASPRVNRSRRLDQGFAHYDDRFASPERSRLASGTDRAELDAQVRDWFQRMPSPRFAWIHLDRDAGRVQLDRLVSRLAEPLEMGATGPGIIFVGLRGETGPARDSASIEREPHTPNRIATGEASAPLFDKIGWRTHRVPLIWRPPATLSGADAGTRSNAASRAAIPPVSRTLASLYDIYPTLRAAAGIPSVQKKEASNPLAPNPRSHLMGSPFGRDLSQLLRSDFRRNRPQENSPRAENAEASAIPSFFVLLEAAGDQVGLAAQDYLYARQRSPLDGTGRPVPTVSLEVRGARFSKIEPEDPLFQGRPRTARLRTGPWRSDVLSSDSPVPQLEFHLARRLDRPSENPTP